MMSDISSLLFLLLRKTPLILVIVAGLILAIIRWKRHRRVSLLATLGLGLYIADIFIFASFNYLLPTIMERGRFVAHNISRIMTSIQVVEDFVYAAVLILLTAAALSQRAPKTTINM